MEDNYWAFFFTLLYLCFIHQRKTPTYVPPICHIKTLWSGNTSHNKFIVKVNYHWMRTQCMFISQSVLENEPLNTSSLAPVFVVHLLVWGFDKNHWENALTISCKQNTFFWPFCLQNTEPLGICFISLQAASADDWKHTCKSQDAQIRSLGSSVLHQTLWSSFPSLQMTDGNDWASETC